VCNGILALEGNGKIYYSEGGYDYYIEKKKQRIREEAPVKTKEQKEENRTRPKPKKMSYKDALELESIHEKIITAETEVERIEKIFALPDFYEKYAEKTNELNRQLEEAKEKVKKHYERWEELERMKDE
jgi:hypothetical protein